MGDRGMIHFKEFDRVEAAIYTHYYGSEVSKVMIKFFQANEAAGSDTRYDDAPYLAARFLTHVMKDDPYGLGWGIIRPGTAEGPVWIVDCGDLVGPERRPRVYREV
jgi:hypothetical protein